MFLFSILGFMAYVVHDIMTYDECVVNECD